MSHTPSPKFIPEEKEPKGQKKITEYYFLENSKADLIQPETRNSNTVRFSIESDMNQHVNGQISSNNQMSLRSSPRKRTASEISSATDKTDLSASSSCSASSHSKFNGKSSEEEKEVIQFGRPRMATVEFPSSSEAETESEVEQSRLHEIFDIEEVDNSDIKKDDNSKIEQSEHKGHEISDIEEEDCFKEEDDNSGCSESSLVESENRNLEFYMNKIKSEPDGDYIENILKFWKNDYSRLEKHHGYIQWLFPIKESGMNGCAQMLQDHEAKTIRKDPILLNRLYRAYEMMLGFYGLVLKDSEGTIGCASNFQARMEHLNKSFHNNLRITRILKCLSEFGCDKLKNPLVVFLMKQAFETKKLINSRSSCLNYWIPTLSNKKDQDNLLEQAKEFQNKEKSTRSRRGYYR